MGLPTSEVQRLHERTGYPRTTLCISLPADQSFASLARHGNRRITHTNSMPSLAASNLSAPTGSDGSVNEVTMTFMASPSINSATMVKAILRPNRTQPVARLLLLAYSLQ
jgi:hypothetical protein